MSKVLVFGATGRVGESVVEQALAAGHDVTAFVRDPRKLKKRDDRLKIAEGDVTKPETVTAAMRAGFDAVVVTVGADPLKPSTLVTDSARAITRAMKEAGVTRYLGITGTAEMPKSFLGEVSIAILRRTPVGHAARDHDGAFAIVTSSGLRYTLAACPYIRDGATRGAYRTARVYPGGFKIIHPGDVAHFLVKAIADEGSASEVVGIWY